jgi:hypothetical protein
MNPSDPTTKSETDRKPLIFYIIFCRKCDNPNWPLPIPFESPEARVKWATAHTAGTGHDKFIVLDQGEDGKIIGRPDALHGGESRPTQEEIAVSLAAKRAEFPELVAEFARIEALLTDSGREVLAGSGLTFPDVGVYGTIYYSKAGHRLTITLREN